MPPPIALTIAGSDPSGGAGIQADLKTFHQFGVYGEAVLTLLTVQNSRGVSRVEPVAAQLIHEQIRALLEDMPPAAIKTGALPGPEAIEAISTALQNFAGPLMIDPILGASSGKAFLKQIDLEHLKEQLFPKAFLITPNLQEAELLTRLEVHNPEQMSRAARHLLDTGARNVLITGGHLAGEIALDLLVTESGDILEFPAPRMDSRHTHGTGCTFSAAITAELAKGTPLPDAIRAAKQFILNAIRTAPGLGSGSGPLNHFAR